MPLRWILELGRRRRRQEPQHVGSDAQSRPLQYDYLRAVRGILAIQTCLWIFFSTFIPSVVADLDSTISQSSSYKPPGLKQSLSVIFWNGHLISSLHIILSARTICIPFLQSSRKEALASSIFRRGISIFVPLASSLAVSYLVQLRTDSFAYLDEYIDKSGNSIGKPYNFPNALSFLNGVFNTMWIQADFAKQAANLAFPTNTLWTISLIYTQSYTVFMTEVIAPHTRPAWRATAGPMLILAAYWVSSWAWYTLTGLLVADVALHLDFFAEMASRGVVMALPGTTMRLRLPAWPLYGALATAGLVMQFLWTDVEPELADHEFFGHAEGYAAPLREALARTGPRPRADAFLVCIAVLLTVETYPSLRQVLGNSSVLTFVGRRSYSESTSIRNVLLCVANGFAGYFLVAALLSCTACVKVWLLLFAARLHVAAVTGVVFLVYAPLVVVCGEVFYVVVERSSRALSHWMYQFMTA